MNRCEVGDCRVTMRSWAAAGVRVRACVTSPPYFGLRDYGHPGQLGLEDSPQAYVAALVDVFEAVRALLHDDGTLWLNLGDCYAGTRGSGADMVASRRRDDEPIPRSDRRWPGFKSKDLMGMPWRVAFALQEAGWYLRQDIIWHKPNPMPESVEDRCTKAHEYVFLLSKSERYFFDSGAIAEPATEAGRVIHGYGTGAKDRKDVSGVNDRRTRIGLANWNRPVPETRRRRSVWTVPTQGYAGAHFAVFPAALVEPCILAGSELGDVVLDPFFGSGTVGQVAQALGRRWLGCEINPEYAALQERRTAQQGMAI